LLWVEVRRDADRGFQFSSQSPQDAEALFEIPENRKALETVFNEGIVQLTLSPWGVEVFCSGRIAPTELAEKISTIVPPLTELGNHLPFAGELSTPPARNRILNPRHFIFLGTVIAVQAILLHLGRGILNSQAAFLAFAKYSGIFLLPIIPLWSRLRHSPKNEELRLTRLTWTVLGTLAIIALALPLAQVLNCAMDRATPNEQRVLLTAKKKHGLKFLAYFHLPQPGRPLSQIELNESDFATVTPGKSWARILVQHGWLGMQWASSYQLESGAAPSVPNVASKTPSPASRSAQ
jgi:hypothetical protein